MGLDFDYCKKCRVKLMVKFMKDGCCPNCRGNTTSTGTIALVKELSIGWKNVR